jgi:hypothetical protein
VSTAQERMDRVVTTAKRLSKMEAQHEANSEYKNMPKHECNLCHGAKVAHDHAVREYTHPEYEEAER